MKWKKKKNRIILLLVLLLSLSLGYALLTQNLDINGTFLIDDLTWDIHFDNIQIVNGSIALSEGDQIPTINPTTNTSVNYTVTLKKPGDFYEFTVDVVNAGNIDAMIESLSSKLNGEEIDNENPLPSYLIYSVTYDNKVDIKPNHLLKAGVTDTYRIRIEFKKDIAANDLPNTAQTLTFNYEVNYIQAESYGYHHPGLGSYFTMVPDVSSYTILATKVGSSSVNQQISPQRLNLWRIIDFHEDGSFEAVSEYTSDQTIGFNGEVGYANFVEVLQEAAAQYAKEGYTIATRMMGYNGQTLTLDPSFLNQIRQQHQEFSSGSPKEGVGEEYQGGILGDTLYLRDIQLVGNVYKADRNYGSTGLKAQMVDLYGTGRQTDYWIASRDADIRQAITYQLSGRVAGDDISFEVLCYFDTDVRYRQIFHPFRPIITLKPGIKWMEGREEKNSPFTISNQ